MNLEQRQSIPPTLATFVPCFLTSGISYAIIFVSLGSGGRGWESKCPFNAASADSFVFDLFLSERVNDGEF